MNLLPWLLDWPPRPRTIVVFLFLTAFSFGTLLLFVPVTDQINPDEATVEVSNVSIHLNDEVTIPDSENGSVATCVASGTPGDHLTVRADIVVSTPMGGGDGSHYDVQVRLDPGSETTTRSVQQTGRDRVEFFWVVRDDESLSVGDTADTRVRLRHSGTVVANSSRVVTVENGSRSYDCEP